MPTDLDLWRSRHPNVGGFLAEHAVAPTVEWWDELTRLGYDVQNMSPMERVTAAADAGMKLSTEMATASGSGLAGLGVLASGGSLEEAATTVQGGMLNTPITHEMQTPEGQTLYDMVGTASEPIDALAQAGGQVALQATDSPAAAAGAETMLGMFLGRKAKGANLRELDAAQGMLKEGRDMNRIRQETGWFQDPVDKQWKTEIPDDLAELNLPEDLEYSFGEMTTPPQTLRLGDALKHDKLYENYPEIADWELNLERPGPEYSGSFNPRRRSIQLAVNKPRLAPPGDPEESGALVRKNEDMLATVLHEVEHGIQYDEGFGLGTSPDTAKTLVFDNLLSQMEPIYPAMNRYDTARAEYGLLSEANDIAKLREMSKPNYNITPSRITNRSDWYEHSDEIRSELGAMPKRSGQKQKDWLRQAARILGTKRLEGSENYYEIQGILDNTDVRERRNAIRRSERAMSKDRQDAREYDTLDRQLSSLHGQDPHQIYYKASGEAEARNVQNRMGMPPKELWENAPWRTMTRPPEGFGPDVPLDPKDVYSTRRDYKGEIPGEEGMMAAVKPKAKQSLPVSTGKLLDTSKLAQVPNVPQVDVPRFEPARGSPKMLEEILTPANTRRVNKLAAKGTEMGGLEWYNMEPLREAFINRRGEAGQRAFDQLMAIFGATSSRAKVPMNIRRGSLFFKQMQQGTFNPQAGNIDMPPGYGHLAHETHQPMLREVYEKGAIDTVARPKTGTFGSQNLAGNWRPETIDAHEYFAWTGRNKSPPAAQYPYIEKHEQKQAEKMGIAPAQYQGSVWVGQGRVQEPRPFIEVFMDRVEETARRENDSPIQVLDDFIDGKRELWGIALGVGAGALATPEDDGEI